MRKYTAYILILFSSVIFSQEEQLPKGWDEITLDGKTAYMNLTTGSISHVFPKKPSTEVKKEKEIEYDPAIIHKVEKGETLYAIARKNSISIDDIYRLNANFNYDKIEVGQEIVIGYKEEDNEKLLNKKIVNSLSKNIKSIDFHIVKVGDTLYSISKLYNISVGQLKKGNELSSNRIFIGQKLKI